MTSIKIGNEEGDDNNITTKAPPPEMAPPLGNATTATSTRKNNNNDHTTSNDDNNKHQTKIDNISNCSSCCARFKSELPCCGSVSMFDIHDPTIGIPAARSNNGDYDDNDDNDDQEQRMLLIDIDHSFHTGPKHGRNVTILFSKFVLWALTVSTYILGISTYTYPYWFMAYISYWTLSYSMVYLTLSMIVATLKSTSYNHNNNHTSRNCCQTFLLRATWVMYPVAITHGLMVVLLFWITEYGPESTLSYFLVMSHAITFALTVVDGSCINHIPIRIQQYGFVVAFGILFIVWTLIQAYLPISNPWKENDDEEVSQNLYNILDWQDAPLASALVAGSVLFVAMPLFTVMFWGISLWGRRYVVAEEGHDGEDEDDGDGDIENGHPKEAQSVDTAALFDELESSPQGIELVDAVQY